MQILVFSDFDGTISLQDTGCLVIDDQRCLGYQQRRLLDLKVLNGEMSFREALSKMWAACDITWDEAWELLKNVKVDPGFPEFYRYCETQNIPITIVSSGLLPMIERLLINFMGASDAAKIEILSNRGQIVGRQWTIEFRDDSVHGHDKSAPLRQARANHPDAFLVFCGDGTSDLSAARTADLLFARSGKDLEAYCLREGIPYNSFDNFNEIAEVVRAVREGKKSVVRKGDAVDG